METKTTGLQKEIDKLLYSSLFKYIPRFIKPNYFTYLRILLVPFLYYLLQNEMIWQATLLFIFSASTDTIDGVLARMRGEISDLGKILDPIADKLLISTVLIYIGLQYLVIKIFLVVILFELIANLAGNLFNKLFNIPIGANLYGKLKMVIQCICIFSFLIGVILKDEKIIMISQYLLYIALFFALLSGFEQLRRRYINIEK